MEHVRPYLTQAETALKTALKGIQQADVEAAAKSVLRLVDPCLDRCTWSAAQTNLAAFYALFAATIIFLTIAQRYTTKANKALIGFSWATGVSALHFFWVLQGSPLADFAIIQSVAGLPFAVYALGSLGGAGFVSFVLVLVHLVAKDYLLALASFKTSFDSRLLYFTYSLAVGAVAGLILWIWALRGGLRGIIVTFTFTLAVFAQRALFVLGGHGLKLLSSRKEALLFAAVEVGSDLALLLLVALLYPGSSKSANSNPAPTARTAAAKPVTVTKKKQ